MSITIYQEEKSSGHGNEENVTEFSKSAANKPFIINFPCGKAVGNVWST